MSVSVRRASWPQDEAALRAVRTDVFVDEQAVPAELEWDGLDDDAEHFVAESAGEVIGCARLLNSGQIGRMAVRASGRGLGTGKALLHAAIDRARELGMERVFLHAQVQVEGFYAGSGFVKEGERFMEAGIEHQGMSMSLGTTVAEFASVLPASAKLGGRTVASFDDSERAIALLRDLIDQAERDLLIYSQQLDRAVFANEDVVSALSHFARRHPRSRIDVLIHDSRRLVGRRHELLELARRLDSKVSIRKVPSEEQDENRTFVVTDTRGLWLLPDVEELSGIACADDEVQAKHLRERFEELGRRARPDPELRTLSL